MQKITLMISVPEVGRADVMLVPDRIYYRFATEDTIEDGDIAGVNDRWEIIAARILDAVKGAEGETPLDPASLKASVFIDNVLRTAEYAPTVESVSRLADRLCHLDESFLFVTQLLRHAEARRQ